MKKTNGSMNFSKMDRFLHPKKTQATKVTRWIRKIYFNLRPRNKLEKKGIVKLLRGFASEHLGGTRIRIYGSYRSKVSTKDGDIDLSVNHELELSDRQVLLTMSRLMRKNGFHVYDLPAEGERKLLCLFGRCRANDIRVDMTVNNVTGVHASQFLRDAVKRCPLLKQLSILLKAIFRAHGLTKQFGCFPSIGIVYLVVFFVQNKGYLPPLLQRRVPVSDSDFETERIKMKMLDKSKRPRGPTINCNLLQNFMTFYLNFNFEDSSICIRSRQLIKRNHSDDAHAADAVCILNPFVAGDNVTHNVSFSCLRRMKNVFRNSIQALEGKLNPNILFCAGLKYEHMPSDFISSS